MSSYELPQISVTSAAMMKEPTAGLPQVVSPSVRFIDTPAKSPEVVILGASGDLSPSRMPLSNVPRHLKSSKQRTPTPYPMEGIEFAEKADADDMIEASLHPQIGTKRSSEHDSLAPDTFIEEDETQDSTVRPKKKPKNAYSGRSGLSDAFTAAPPTTGVMFSAGPFTGANENGVEFQFGSVPSRSLENSNSQDFSGTLKTRSSGRVSFLDQAGEEAMDQKKVAQNDALLRDLPPRPSAPEPGAVPSIPSKPASREGSVSPPASLDIFNPFDDPVEEVEVELSDSDTTSDTGEFSSRRSSSLSSTSTVHSEVGSFVSALSHKWEDSFDDYDEFDDQYKSYRNFPASTLPRTVNFGSNTHSPSSSIDRTEAFPRNDYEFEAPFFDESVARTIGSKIGLGLPSSTLVTLGANSVRIRDTVVGDNAAISEDRPTSQIILTGPTSERIPTRMPSWDFGDTNEEKNDVSAVSIWDRMNGWMRAQTEPQQIVNFAIGGSALSVLCFSLYSYLRRP